jgi:APA family basic amino acid/polyamine antiporter
MSDKSGGNDGEKSGLKLTTGSRPGQFFVRRIVPPHLRRVLGVSGLFATAYGNVGSSIYYALGVVAMSALGLTPPVLILSGIIFLFTALTYAEGATALPEAGGSGAFAKRAFNDLVSFIASWVLMMDYIVTIAISAYAAANYLGYFFPLVKAWPGDVICAVSIVLILAGINTAGLKESSRLNVSLVIMDIATQVSVAVVGVVMLINLPVLLENVRWGTAPTLEQLLFGISISMVAYTGIETVANLGGEAREPSKSIPRAVLLVFGTVIVLYTFLSLTAMSAYPVYQAADGSWVTDLTRLFLDDPIQGIVFAMPAMIRPVMGFWVAILAVTILVIATNAGILGASRLAYSMGQRQHLPAAISRISKRTRVPVNAIMTFSLVACGLIAMGGVTFLADLYAFGAMLAYTSAHVSIIALRIKEPFLKRPFRIPLSFTVKGRQIPLTSVIGGLATAATWFIVVFTHHLGRIVGFAWLAIGIGIYVWYRRHHGLPIIGSPGNEPVPEPPEDKPAEA